MIPVAIYCRVSSTEQAEEGYSLGEQEARLRAYATAQGWTVQSCHVDPGFSGAKLNRPGLMALIDDVQNHRVQKVITYKLDRLSRSQKDTLYLIEDVFLKNGVDYISMTESFDTGSPFGRAIIGILSVFAQLERENIAERMMLGRVASAKQGNWHGGSGVPIGYRYIPKSGDTPGQLIVDQDEAQLVRTVFDMFLSGFTFHAIYERCSKRFMTSYGPFGGGGSARVPLMLENRIYIGEIKYCGEWYKSSHEPIISPETFQRAQDKMIEYQAALDEHRRVPFRNGHLLSGFLFCGECGSRWCYHGGRYTTKSGEVRKYGTYQCYTKNSRKGMAKADHCSLPVWSDVELDSIVWEQISSLDYDDITQSENPVSDELSAVQSKIAGIDKQMGKLIDLYTLGTIPIEQIQSRSEDLRQKRDKLQKQADVILRKSSAGPDPEIFRSALASVGDIRDNGTLDEQRDLIRILIKRIVLLPDREIHIEWNI